MFRKLHEADCTIEIQIDGQAVSAEPGESVAAVLLRAGSGIARTTPVRGTARAPYCMMGVCFDCLATVDGVPSMQTCLVTVRPGMRIERQHGKRSFE